MAGYDYGNARVRAMKSRLLDRHDLEALARAGDVQNFLTMLAGTAYRNSVEAALAYLSGLQCLAEALRRDLTDTLGKLQTFYRDRERELITAMLRRYDVQNVKAILRGLDRHATPDQIAMALLPIGEIPISVLDSLTRAPLVRAAIDVLASMRWSVAQPLVLLRVERPMAEVQEMELALDRWYFDATRQILAGASEALSALDVEADLTNLLTVLRFAQTSAERLALQAGMGVGGLEALLVTPGTISSQVLVQAGLQDTPEAALNVLAGTSYALALRAGLEAYHRSGLLSEFEHQLNHWRLRRLARQIAGDPLGIGVPLGYIALKINEVKNIGWAGQAISLGLPSSAIQRELEFAA